MFEKVLVVDTETTGLSQDRLPWEVSYVDPESGYSRVLQIAYDDEVVFDPQADAVNRRLERFDPAVAIPAAEAVWMMWPDLDKAIFVGSKPSFDQDTLANLYRQQNLVGPWSHRYVDVPSLVSGRLRKPVYGLKGAALALGLDWDENQAHSALYDTLKCSEAYRKVMLDA